MRRNLLHKLAVLLMWGGPASAQEVVMYATEWARPAASSRLTMPRSLVVTDSCAAWVVDPPRNPPV